MNARVASSRSEQHSSTLTAGRVHELNNLLAVILGRAELLQQEQARDSGNRRAISDLVLAAERAAALLRGEV